jgi:hypothetical protein
MLERLRKTRSTVWPEDFVRLGVLRTKLQRERFESMEADKEHPRRKLQRSAGQLANLLAAMNMPVGDDSSTMSVEVMLTSGQQTALETSRQEIAPELGAAFRESLRQMRNTGEQDMI